MISQALAQKRSHIFSLVRRFFTERSFLEVDTPLLVRLPGMEPYLDVFKTRFEPMREGKVDAEQGSDLYLITSPEYALKRLLADGYEKIFQISKCFRNKETGGSLHNPEFTMIEWYRTQADYTGIMRDTAELLRFLVRELFGGTTFVFQGREIDVSQVETVTMQELFEKYAGISKEVFEDENLFRDFFGEKYGAHHSFDDLFFLVFLNQIEPYLGFPHPVMITEYPASMAALARLCPANPKYAERTELYIAGMEFANGFSELNDAVEQRRRLEEERAHRQKLGKLDYPLDEKFLEAVSRMPESSGIALGLDRLIMLLLDAKSIQEVVFFPFEEL